MKNKSFDEYLQAKHFEENPQILDDDLSEAFDDWIDNLDIQKLIDYAEDWGSKLIK